MLQYDYRVSQYIYLHYLLAKYSNGNLKKVNSNLIVSCS